MMMNAVRGREVLKPHAWAVVPSPHEACVGVPVYGYFDDQGGFHHTSVMPGDLKRSALWSTFNGMQEVLDLSGILRPELGDTSNAVADAVHAFMAFRTLPAYPGEGGAGHPDIAGGLVEIEGHNEPAVRLATAGTTAGLLVVSSHQGVARLHTVWLPLHLFVPDPEAFGRHTVHITEAMLAAGLAEQRLDGGMAALEALASDRGRVVPDVVVAAMVLTILEGTNRHHPVRRRGNALLNAIYDRAGLLDDEGLQYALSGLSGVRSALKVITSMRKVGKETQYDAAAASPAWERLMESLTDNMAATAAGAGIAGASDIDQVRAALRMLAEESTDDYTRAMVSPAGRLVAGLAEASANPVETSAEETPLLKHVRHMVRLLGPHPWHASRPFDFGVMCTVMGNW